MVDGEVAGTAEEAPPPEGEAFRPRAEEAFGDTIFFIIFCPSSLSVGMTLDIFTELFVWNTTRTLGRLVYDVRFSHRNGGARTNQSLFTRYLISRGSNDDLLLSLQKKDLLAVDCSTRVLSGKNLQISCSVGKSLMEENLLKYGLRSAMQQLMKNNE